MAQIPTALRGALRLALGALLLWVAPALAQPPEPQRAGLLVVHGDGSVVTRCIAFDAPTLSGLDLLQRADLDPVLASGGLGAAVCALDGAGCPATDCFCACKGTPCAYWTYYRREAEGAWAYSGLGAAATTVRHGDVDAWVWGAGLEPPALDFAAICGETVAPPDAQPSPSPTAAPIPEETPSAEAGNYGAFLLLAGALALLALFHRTRRR